MQAKWWAFGLWMAVAALGVYWGLKLGVQPLPVPAQARAVVATAPPQGDLSHLLGADPVAAVAEAPPASARFQLVGVVAPLTPDASGVAVIAIDGRAPKTFRVGAVVEGDTVLQSVAQRGAQLGPRGGAATVALSVAALPPAATGQLASALPPAPTPAPVVGVPGGPRAALPGQTATPAVPLRPGFVPPRAPAALPNLQAPPPGADGPDGPGGSPVAPPAAGGLPDK
jgi:general secretion pathway protein C